MCFVTRSNTGEQVQYVPYLFKIIAAAAETLIGHMSDLLSVTLFFILGSAVAQW